jgi:hypothetical protein
LFALPVEADVSREREERAPRAGMTEYIVTRDRGCVEVLLSSELHHEHFVGFDLISGIGQKVIRGPNFPDSWHFELDHVRQNCMLGEGGPAKATLLLAHMSLLPTDLILLSIFPPSTAILPP